MTARPVMDTSDGFRPIDLPALAGERSDQLADLPAPNSPTQAGRRAGGQAGPPAQASQADVAGESPRRVAQADLLAGPGEQATQKQADSQADSQAGTRRISRLHTRARQATQLRGLQTLPDVVALHVERVRTKVNTCIWLAILLGLAFTMANVQHFAAEGAEKWSTGWTTAWLIDPMINIVLLGVLWAEQEFSRYEIESGATIRATKWMCFSTTYALNTWSSWLALDPAGIVLHSVPPLVVLTAAEVGPALRHRLTQAIELAYAEAADPTGQARKQARAARQATKTRPSRRAGGQATRSQADNQAARRSDAPARPGGQASNPPTPNQASSQADAQAAGAQAAGSPAAAQPTTTGGPADAQVVSIAAQAGDAELVARVLELDAQKGRRVGRDAIKTALDVGSPRAVRLRRLADQAGEAGGEVAG